MNNGNGIFEIEEIRLFPQNAAVYDYNVLSRSFSWTSFLLHPEATSLSKDSEIFCSGMSFKKKVIERK